MSKLKYLLPLGALVFQWLIFSITTIRPEGVLDGQQEQQQLRFLPTSAENLSKTQDSDGNDTYDTSNLIFASFSSLLQQWPNSFAPSGHSIIPGIIPSSTLLYHGLHEGLSEPKGIEWLAFDPDMSYKVHSRFATSTTLLTYITERPLRVIYLDGQSASLGRPGFVDSQDILISGRVEEKWPAGNIIAGDYVRADGLCAVGKEFGFEGVVRMNTGFELIWCDFVRGIKLIGRTNSTDPFMPPSKGVPSFRPWDPSGPLFSAADYMAAQSATWHNYGPGEARVILDPSGFVSFYDRIDSLAEKRRIDGTEDSGRPSHRLYGISEADVQEIKQRLIKVLERKNKENWTINNDQANWRTVALIIKQRYEQRIQELDFLLKSQSQNATMTVIDVRAKSYAMIMPYVDFSMCNDTNFKWLDASISKCATEFTSGHFTKGKDLTDPTDVIKGAIEGTLDRICKSISKIFSETLEMRLPEEKSKYDLELEKRSQIKVDEWRTQIKDLIHWLGWSFPKCEPGCSPNEICMPPMWPACIMPKSTSSKTEFPFCTKLTKLIKPELFRSCF